MVTAEPEVPQCGAVRAQLVGFSPLLRRSPHRTGKVSSLSRQVSNSGLMTHAVTLCALADDATRGSRFSSRSASGRFMMGSEGWGGNNLNGVLAANQRQDRETFRTHPILRHRDDSFLPQPN